MTILNVIRERNRLVVRSVVSLSLFMLVVAVTSAVGAKDANGKGAGSPGFTTFQQARRDMVDLVGRSGCLVDGPLRDFRVTYNGFELTGRVAFGMNDFRNGHFAVSFSDIKSIDTLVKWSRPAQCMGWGDSVRLELSSRQPNRYLWILLTSQDAALQFGDDLKWLVAHASENSQSAMLMAERFKQQAATWRNATVKPEMPEEARVHKVLAENAFHEQRTDKAIAEYHAALNIFPTWPEGQFNLALLCGETRDFDCAVEHMQNYLELAPNAPNAEAAKDKLIIWKDNLGESSAPTMPQTTSTRR